MTTDSPDLRNRADIEMDWMTSRLAPRFDVDRIRHEAQLRLAADVGPLLERLDQSEDDVNEWKDWEARARGRADDLAAELAAAQARAESAEAKVQRVEALRALWNHDGQLRVGMAPGEVRNAQMAAWASDQLGRLLAAGDAARPQPDEAWFGAWACGCSTTERSPIGIPEFCPVHGEQPTECGNCGKPYPGEHIIDNDPISVSCPMHTARNSTRAIHDGFIGQCDACAVVDA